MNRIAACAVAAALGWSAATAYAKLPAPTDEQKAKSAEAKARADEAAKRDAEALVKYQDRAADRYKRTRATVKAEAKR